MLPHRVIYAIKALLELAQQPGTVMSVQHVANRQGIPAPMLEQVFLQLRRAGLVQSRRGRRGGYVLAQPARSIALQHILSAINGQLRQPVSWMAQQPVQETVAPGGKEPNAVAQAATDQVLLVLQGRLERALDAAMLKVNLEELLFDLQSWRASLDDDQALML